jgi:DNA polymerase-1
MSNNLLLVDFSNTVIRSLAVNSQLTWNGQVTGGLYGTVMQLVAKIKMYQPSCILVCKDHAPYLRAKLYPNYKSDRKNQKPPSWYEDKAHTFQLVDQFLNLSKIPVWDVAGFEADDLIAKVVEDVHDYFDNVYILSNDDDLFALLHYENVTLLKKSGNFDYDKFKNEYPDLEPRDWVTVTAMTGTHNNIQGIDRCGLKTAIKWMKDYKYTGTWHPKVLENAELIGRNMLLINLPFLPNELNFDKKLLTRPKINRHQIMGFLSEYGIVYTDTMDEAFKYLSSGNY